MVGIGAVMPGAADAAAFWRNVLDGRDLITDVPPDHWLVEDYHDPEPGTPNKTRARRGAFLPEVDFAPLRHRVPPNDLPMTDTAQLLGLVVAEQVLTDLVGGLAGLDRERVSVVLGASTLEMMSTVACRMQYPVWMKVLREQGVPESRARAIRDGILAQYVPGTEATFPGLLTNVVAGRIANRFDLHGTNHTTDAACASSLAALHTAVAELALHRADLVLTGGVDAANGIDTFMCFTETPALSPTGDCRPFSEGADGTMLGEGIAMFALKRLADAERDADRVYAVIRGIGTSSDGGGTAVYAPVPEGQARALRRAYRQAGYEPGTVELVEAHGTGTAAGDGAEFRALREVFDDGREDRQWCALGSVKSQIGHTKAAAGAAGLLKAVLAVHHGVLPPTLKVTRPEPGLDLPRSPFHLNTATRPWVRGPGHPRRASVSSFGFGGSNFHVTLEEYAPAGGGRAAWRYRSAPTELVLFGADSPDDLLASIGDLDFGRALPDLARESQRAFSARRSHRLAVVAADVEALRHELAAAARSVAAGEPFSTPTGAHHAVGPSRTGRIAFLFPGQGSQYVGMGADLAVHEPRARAVWDAFAAGPGDRLLHRVVFPPPAFTDDDREAQRRLLTRTEWAQPALAVHSLALLEVLDALGLRPDCAAGHSFGELVALRCAGALTSADLVRLARARGEVVAAAARTPGAMLAVAAGLDEVTAALDRYGEERVWVANDNGPTQVVLSGAADAVDRLAHRFAADGRTTTRLEAATAFHSPLVAAASTPLREFLDRVDVRSPRIPVYGDADAAVYPGEPDEVRRRLAGQVASPVRFAEVVEAMHADGVRTFVEVGAKSSLCGLVGSVLGGREHLAVGLDRADGNGVTAFQRGLARLAVAGVELDYEALWRPCAPPGAAGAVDDRDGEMTVQINGANFGRPYPPAGGAAALPPPNPEPAPVPVPVPAVEPAAGPAVDADVLRLFAEAQRDTARAHEEYQRSLTESHLAFLRMSEASFGALLGAGGTRAVAPTAGQAPPPVHAPSTTPVAPVPPAPISVVPMSADAVPAAPVPVTPVPVTPVAPASAPVAPVPVAPAVSEPPRPEPSTVEEVLRSVVADRTGYPVEMVRPDMALDEDLGVDSIKRVEIFSALRQRMGDTASGSTATEVAELSKLRTLREIADRIGGRTTPPAPGPATPAEGGPRPTTLTRLVLRTANAAAPGAPLPGLGDGPVAVLGGPTGLGALVARRLADRGVPARETGAVPADARGLLLLGGLGEARSPAGAATAARDALRAAAQVAAAFAATGGAFVTVQDTGGDFGLSGAAGDRAWLGGFGALARTAAAEWPRASVKSIDCEQAGRDPDEVADAIVLELLTGGAEPEVGLRADGSRLVPHWAPVPVAPGAPLEPEPVLVVTGGARGVTARALLRLARTTHRPRVLLLGRTAPGDEPEGPDHLRDAVDEPALIRALARDDPGRPPRDLAREARRILAAREVRATLDALRRAGARVEHAVVDVRDAEAVRAAVAAARAEWGPITGVVHGAGALADSAIGDRTDEGFDRAFTTKVEGLHALLSATATDPLRLLCLFSSVAGSFGNAGQADYAMANAVLDRVASAERARRPGCLVRSLAWGPWDGGMVTSAHAERFRANGVALIPPDDGATAFTDELTDPDDVRVVLAASDPRPALTGREVTVDRRSHPHLADHAIAGVPVLPAAVVLDWFTAFAARSDRVVLRDLRVLRGVALPDGHARLLLHATSDADGPLVLLRAVDGTTHYRVRPVAEPGDATALAWAPPADLEPLGRHVYDGRVLFHGPRFRSLVAVDGVADGGAAGVVAGAAELGWEPGEWLVDPAAADGAFQLACLWADRVLGGRALPMAVGEVRVHRPGPVAGTLRCVLLAGRVHHSDALCDVALLDPAGRPVLELLDVDVVRYPDEG